MQLAKWSSSSKKVLSTAFFRLREILIKKMSPYCMHLKGRGGIKGSVRCFYKQKDQFPYVAKFDVKSYYGSINHNILFGLLNKLQIDQDLMKTITEYVRVPDTECKGKGITAGGTLSTLLGAVYLSPLYTAMHKLYKKGDIFNIRYVDDIVILAKTRWKLKKAIKLMHQTIERLRLKTHRDEKRFIGKTSKGFSFLGYYFKPGRKPRPSRECLKRFVRNVKQLLELVPSVQTGADCMTPTDSDAHNHSRKTRRLYAYIRRFHSYLRAGLGEAASNRRLHRLLKLLKFKCRANSQE